MTTGIRIERLVLDGLLRDPGFLSVAVNHIKPEYFEVPAERALAQMIGDYSSKYGSAPGREALSVDATALKVSEDVHRSLQGLVTDIFDSPRPEYDRGWLVDSAERFCKDRALIGAIVKSIAVYEGEDKKLTKEAIPGLIEAAAAVGFHNTIGHDYFRDAEAQYAFYTTPEVRIPFDLPIMNQATGGGAYRKTLNVYMSSKTGGFKSGLLCHHTSHWLRMGYSVLYITLELSENHVRQRIDANLLGVNMDDLRTLSKERYLGMVDHAKRMTTGRLLVKEYPSASVHAGHFRFMIKEARQKEGFTPDIIVVDYLNLCLSNRFSGNRDANSYTIIKAVAEELRGLAVETNTALWTATQSGRQGNEAGESIDVEDVSESYGLPSTSDLFWALVLPTELEDRGMIMVKQLKNRYREIGPRRKFILGMEKVRMSVFETTETRQASAEVVAPAVQRTENRTVEAFEGWKL